MAVAAHDTPTLLQALLWLAAYQVVNPITVCLLVVAKLLVLDRLMDFSKLKASSSSHRWALFGRVLLAVVVSGSIVGLVSNIVSALMYSQAADLYAVLAAGNSSGLDTFAKRRDAHEHAKFQSSKATRAGSVYFAFECIMLLLVVAAFSCAGAASIRRVHAALRGSGVSRAVSMKPVRADRTASAARLSAALVDPAVAVRGQELQRQIFFTCSVVFLSFLIRAVYSIVFVVAGAAQNVDADCGTYGDTKCRVCNNAFANMLVALLYTPQIHFGLMLISQPVALLVALWGMTSGQILSVMGARDADPQQ
jgi:hypothetical protein